MITFTVPAVPIAQPRPRIGMRFAKGGGRRPGVMRDENHPVHGFKATVAIAARQAYQGPPLNGPLQMNLYFYLPRPKRLNKKRSRNQRCWHPCKPDLDNLEKAVLDALKGLTWQDDSQVAEVLKRKMYAAQDETPNVRVEISQLASGDALTRMV